MRFLLCAAAAWLLVGLAPSLAPSAAQDAGCRATLRDYGAAGDGVKDDAGSIAAALRKGCTLDGEGLRYRITRSLSLPSNTNLRSLTLLQAIPAGELIRPLFGRDIENVTLTDVRVDRGSDPYNGSIEDAAGIWIDNARNLTLTDVEVRGDGPGTGILIVKAMNVVLIRPYVHDMRWALREGQPCNEVLQGIRVHASANVTIDAPRVGNLLPENIVMTQAGVDGCARRTPPQARRVGQINNMTDGINPTGNQGARITNPEIWRTGEGFDISGDGRARDLLIRGGNLHDIASACYKLTSRQGPDIVIRDSRAVRCGLWGYVVIGPVTGLSLIDNTAVDTGSSGAWKAGRAGFHLSYPQGRGDDAMPTNVTFTGNRAIDTQSAHTMDYGFFVRPDPSGRDQHITFDGNTSTGHRGAATMCDMTGGHPDTARTFAWCTQVTR